MEENRELSLSSTSTSEMILGRSILFKEDDDDHDMMMLPCVLTCFMPLLSAVRKAKGNH